MKMLIDSLQQVSADPYSWGVVALLGGAAGFNVYHWLRCPYLCHSQVISPEESRESLDRPFVAGPRFVIVMLAGIASILAGIAMVSRGMNPPLALLLIAGGVFAVQTEPGLLRIQEAARRVVAAQLEGAGAISSAEDRLRQAHLGMVTASVGTLVAVILALLAF